MEPWRHEPLAVLASGGIDSAVLVAELAAKSPRVQPIYVRFGLIWEEAEERAMRQFLAAIERANVAELLVFELPIAAIYGRHWSTGGEPPPDYDSPDEAVFLPGRNLLLLAQATVWCHLHGIRTLAMGPLAGNPFPDATDDFFRDYLAAANRAVEGTLAIVRPFQTLHKVDVLERGRELPLGLTFSCIRPIGDLHCGRCNKCAERQRGFEAAGMPDPTEYA